MKKRPTKLSKLTPEQLTMIEGMAQQRLPLHNIAMILGVSDSKLDKMIRENEELRQAIYRGRAVGTQKAYRSAFELATGYTRVHKIRTYNQRTGRWTVRTREEDVPPDPNMLRFWLKTQEGWRETDRIEISGPGGGPVQVEEMSVAEREAHLDKLLKLRERIRLARGVQPQNVIEAKGEPVESEEE